MVGNNADHNQCNPKKIEIKSEEMHKGYFGGAIFRTQSPFPAALRLPSDQIWSIMIKSMCSAFDKSCLFLDHGNMKKDISLKLFGRWSCRFWYWTNFHGTETWKRRMGWYGRWGWMRGCWMWLLSPPSLSCGWPNFFCTVYDQLPKVVVFLKLPKLRFTLTIKNLLFLFFSNWICCRHFFFPLSIVQHCRRKYHHTTSSLSQQKCNL